MTYGISEKLRNARTEQEKKTVVEQYKNEIRLLSDEELDRVAGGRPSCSPGCYPIENGCSC